MFGRDIAMNQTCYALESRWGTPFWLNCLFTELVPELVQGAHGSVFDTITTNTLPLSQRLIRRAHEVLMQGVRGRNKDPGQYRRIPNWIGPDGCAVEQARFIPCSAERLPDRMSEWERYLHADAPDRLVQLAIIHAEFEAT